MRGYEKEGVCEHEDGDLDRDKSKGRRAREERTHWRETGITEELEREVN